MKGIEQLLLNLIQISFDRPTVLGREIDENISKNRSLSSSVRRELTQLIHDSLRWRRRLWGDIAPSSLDIEKVKTELAEAKALRNQPPFAKWSKMSVTELSRELSYPNWVIERWIHQLGLEPTISLALAQNEESKVCFRVNTLKTDRESLIDFLTKEGLKVSPGTFSPWALHLNERHNIRGSRAFKNGWLEFQDEGSQLCALMTDVQSNQKVLDACARSGGKTLALSAMMENTGSITACDIDSRTLDRLNQRAKRCGVKNVTTKWVAPDDPNPLPEAKEKFDVVLVDAPCSGLGTLRRQSWLKWTLSPLAVEEYPKTQLKILSRYEPYLKKGGSLVYVTCTINQEENEDIVDRFLRENENISMIETTQHFRPDVEGTDGFFVAKIKKRS